ncbi:MAG: ribosomal-protein-alanine acetyltransferase [Fibrobacteres bacterium]|nr:ribosomal-protein-alanine acetyltransferase [Fibrobacterota bacterium]
MLRTDLAAVLAIEAQANPVPWKAGDFEVFLRPPFHVDVPSVPPASASGTVTAPADGAAEGAPPDKAMGPMGWVWADPEVQGFACAVGAADEAELQAIAVARDHWSRGVGSALMESLCAWARSNGLRTLHLEVREGNARALEFYARWGFTSAGRRPKYYRDNAEAALLLVKSL